MRRSIPPSYPIRRAHHGFLWSMLIAAVLALPHVFASGLGIAVLNQMFIMVVFSLAYNMLLGQGGMLSFGHAVYFGIGGYLSIHGLNAIADHGWAIPLPFVPVVGGVAGLILSAVIGSFSTGRAGMVFAMISLGVGEMMASLSLIFISISGGEDGVTTDRTLAHPLFGQDFASELSVYHLIAVWMVLAIFLMYHFTRTPLGRMANAVGDNPERAQFLGYSARFVRFLSFCASGMFAGVAGALFAINYEIVTDEAVGVLASGVVLLQVYIGGVGYFAGPIVGAVVFTLLQTVLSNYTEIWALYVGIFFVVLVMYAPSGLAGLVMMHQPIWRSGSWRVLVRPYAIGLLPLLLASVGAVGLLEHVQAVSAAKTEFSIAGVKFDTMSWSAWSVFGALLVLNFLVAKQTVPTAVDAYHQALKRAYQGAEDAAP